MLRASKSFVCLANFKQYWANLGCRSNPARLFRIGHRKGAIEPGRDADLVVMAHHPRRYEPAASIHNLVGWSPYEGIELPFRAVATFLRGRPIFDGKTVTSEPGAGAFVRPEQ